MTQTTFLDGVDGETYTPLPCDLIPENMVRYCTECAQYLPWSDVRQDSGMCQPCHEDTHSDCSECGQECHNDDKDVFDRCTNCITKCCKCKQLCGPGDYSYDDDGDVVCEDCQTNTLSVDGDTVYSNEGCTVPLRHVAKSLPHLIHLMKTLNGKRWRPKGVIYWGEYTVDYINTSGELAVGCHRFTLEELERFQREEL